MAVSVQQQWPLDLSGTYKLTKGQVVDITTSRTPLGVKVVYTTEIVRVYNPKIWRCVDESGIFSIENPQFADVKLRKSGWCLVSSAPGIQSHPDDEYNPENRDCPGFYGLKEISTDYDVFVLDRSKDHRLPFAVVSPRMNFRALWQELN